MNDRILFCPSCKDGTRLKLRNEINTTYKDEKYYITIEWYCSKCKRCFLKTDVCVVIKDGPLIKNGLTILKKKYLKERN